MPLPKDLIQSYCKKLEKVFILVNRKNRGIYNLRPISLPHVTSKMSHDMVEHVYASGRTKASVKMTKWLCIWINVCFINIVFIIMQYSWQKMAIQKLSYSTAILRRVLSFVTCESRTHTEVTVCDKKPNLLTNRQPRTLYGKRTDLVGVGLSIPNVLNELCYNVTNI